MVRHLPLALLLVAGCSEPAGGPLPAYDSSGEHFFDAPWPSDARRDDDGTVSLAGFPNPEDEPLLADYLALGEQATGFGTNSPVFVRFEGPLDLARLPDAAASVASDSPVLLLDVDPASPSYGQAWPFTWDFQEQSTRYQPANLLAVAPLWGFPLRPDTRYALVVTTAIADPHPGFADELAAGGAPWDSLREALFLHGLARRDVAIATTFTTDDPASDMRTIARFLRERVEPGEMSQPVSVLAEHDTFHLLEANYLSPVFQHGQRPYASEGGGFAFRDDGLPLIHSWDDMRLAISTPVDVSSPPPGGWPVVIYQHGTGGSYTSFASNADPLEPAAQFAQAGMVGMGIDQPLHGPRGGSGASDFLHFNFMNPEAGRTNFRQGALDAVFLAQAVAQTAPTFTRPDGTEIPIDPERVYFMGHSQGGLTGSIALPFLSPFVDAAVLSGAGGGLSITVVERKDPVDIAALASDALGLSSAEVLDTWHPTIGIVQWLAEPADPINYAPYWFAEHDGWAAQRPLSVLVFSGLQDVATPSRTAEALASAARTPQVAPAMTDPTSLQLRGLPPEPGPVQGNASAFDGRVTAAFSQWDDNHWVVFHDRQAARQYRTFLGTATEGEPAIEETQQR